MNNWTLLTILVSWIVLNQAEILDDVLSVAFCIARCSDDLCGRNCNETTANITEIPFIQEDSEANISLQCRDVNRLVLKHNPGIYVIESKSKNDDVWRFPIVSKEMFYEFKNLKPGSQHQYRIRKITSWGVTLPETTDWFETHEESYIPKEVKNISVSDIEISRMKTYQMQIYLDIVPANDLNCLYSIIHWGEEHDMFQYRLDAARTYRFKLRHLDYNTNNTIHVISRNEVGLQQSKNVSLTFMTPTCLSIHHDLSICAPPKVTGLQIFSFQSNKKSMNFKITWNQPELYPNNYTVIVQPFDLENRSVEVTVSGNESKVDIPNVALSHQYRIGVLAESDGGSSLQWKTLPRTEQSIEGSQVIVAISTLTSLVIFLTITYTYCRYKHFKGHACRYSFFENINRKGCTIEDVKSPLKCVSAYDTEEIKPKDKFEIQPDRLIIKKKLGSGISGIVKLATLQCEQKKSIDVAVKMLWENASAEDVRNFHREILLMKSAGNHRNIVSLIGCCTLDKTPLLIVEYCSKGDLKTYLRTVLEEMMEAIVKRVEWTVSSEGSLFLQKGNNEFTRAINNRLYDIQQEAFTENKLTPEDLLNFSRQVATGMEFLSLNRILHRDLAARNVLVCSDRTVKISDFGLSRDIYQENVYKKEGSEKLPLKWMAIEALTHQVYTTHSDVWSFGVLLYEIVTLGGNPYPGLESSQILHLLKSGYRMKRPSNCGFQLYEIMRSCWHENPLNRPTFNQLKHQLDGLLSAITQNEYLNLTEVFWEPAQHRHFANLERKTQNMLTMPSIT